MATQVLSPTSTKRLLEDDPLQETQGKQKKARVDYTAVDHYWLIVNKEGVTRRIWAHPRTTLTRAARRFFPDGCFNWEDDRNNGTCKICVYYPDEGFHHENPLMGEFLEAIGMRTISSFVTPRQVLIGRYDGKPFVTKHVEALEKVAAWARLVTEISDKYDQLEQAGGDDYEGPDEEPEYPDAPGLQDISDCEEEEEEEDDDDRIILPPHIAVLPPHILELAEAMDDASLEEEWIEEGEKDEEDE
jgi:hypothetical protein